MSEQKLVRALLVDIMGTDCTNKGITSGQKYAYLLHEHGETEIDLNAETQRYPVLVLCEGPFNSINVKPLDHKNKWYMFGGQFVYSCDSRFSEYSRQPIHVHDRREG